MEYLWLYLGVLITWILITFAGAAQSAVKAVKSGTKVAGGVSLMPGILIMPILFTCIAWIINIKWTPIGFWFVGSLHLIIGIWALGYFIYAVVYTKRHGMKP